MTTLIKAVIDGYEEFINNGDPRITPWPLMSGAAPTITIVIIYLLFVKIVGPAYMSNKKPYVLRYPMILYNFGIVTTHIYFLAEAINILFIRQNTNWTCRIDADKMDPDNIRIAELGWLFYMYKILELGDTIFFVLRKKYKSISMLHLVHHSIVPFAAWCGLRIEPGSYNYFFPFINSIVHTIMYSYYGLAALGPQVYKYLWWKKYLTTLQLTQFVMVFIYVINLVIIGCPVSKFVIYLYVFLAGLFFVMFCNYYYQTYVKKGDSKKQK